MLPNNASRASVADRRGSEVVPNATAEIDPSDASSLPIPLLVLGGLSFALLAAGGIGYLSRRRDSEDKR
jgi:hypothetical protein